MRRFSALFCDKKTKTAEILLRVTDKDRDDLSTISFGTQLRNLA